MKIIELKSENIKRVKAIEITPKDNVVVISGKNGQGKTSILDSIWYALDGKSSLKNTPMPIREGEKSAKVQITLNDFVVTRNWTKNDVSYLKVTDRKGLTYNSPQDMLNKFIGDLTFDPLAFAQMKDKEQRELLLKVTKVDMDYWDKTIEEKREERTIKGREVKMLSGEREPITIEDLPEKVISVSDISDKLQEAILVNAEIEKTINAKGSAIKKIEELNGYIEVYDKYLNSHKNISTNELKDELSKSREINEQVMAKERNRTADEKKDKAQAEYDNYTAEIEELENGKAGVLSDITMPIEGLGVNDEGVTFDDIPFRQLSSSEQLKVSLGIAMAINPELKIIRITDGSLLDDDNMKIITTLAKDKDYQIWIEKVDSSGSIGFYIEDGKVKYDNNDVPF